jgi:hypothetical protein
MYPADGTATDGNPFNPLFATATPPEPPTAAAPEPAPPEGE